MAKETLTLLTKEQLIEKQTETYARLCDKALIDWQKGEPLGFGEECKVLKGRKYFEIIRGRKGACCHMGYVEIATGKLLKEQRQAARWDLLDNKDANLLFANVKPFGHHLYADVAKKIKGAN